MLKHFKLPTYKDERGPLSVLEFDDYIAWTPKRVYFLSDVSMSRGSHSVKGEKKIYICQKGSVEARFHDGKSWHDFSLSGYGDSILMEGDYFREFFNFSTDCTLLAISSLKYNQNDYIFDLDKFIEYVKNR